MTKKKILCKCGKDYYGKNKKVRLDMGGSTISNGKYYYNDFHGYVIEQMCSTCNRTDYVKWKRDGEKWSNTYPENRMVQ